jgi:hypothetical protein
MSAATPLPGYEPCATCGEPAGPRPRCDSCGATVVQADAHLRSSLAERTLPRSYARLIVLAAVGAAALAVAAGWFLGPPPPTPSHVPGGPTHATSGN